MELQALKDLLALAEQTGWKTFEVEKDGFHFKLEREGIAQAPMSVEFSGFSAPKEEAAPVEQPTVAAPTGKDLDSPLVGIFHELTGEKKVRAGDSLKRGDVVCTIEAMKLMNEILMPEDGTVSYIAVEEGDMVEYGQVLIKYN